MEQQPSPKSLFAGASPKLTFLFGLATGIIGSAIILGILIMPKLYSNAAKGASNAKATSPTAATTAPSAAADRATAPAGNVKAIGNGDHVRGAKNPKLYLVEYSDFECPFCKQFHPSMQQALQEYSDQVAWVYRHFPLSFHANAAKEAEASECVNEIGGQEKFWAFTDKIFERTTSNGTGFALDALGPLAKEVGVDQAKFQSCLDSGTYAARVNQDVTDGGAAGVTGTPTTFLVGADGKTITGITGAQPYANVKAAIDQGLKK